MQVRIRLEPRRGEPTRGDPNRGDPRPTIGDGLKDSAADEVKSVVRVKSFPVRNSFRTGVQVRFSSALNCRRLGFCAMRNHTDENIAAVPLEPVHRLTTPGMVPQRRLMNPGQRPL